MAMDDFWDCLKCGKENKWNWNKVYAEDVQICQDCSTIHVVDNEEMGDELGWVHWITRVKD
jgi:hypothetical protein